MFEKYLKKNFTMCDINILFFWNFFFELIISYYTGSFFRINIQLSHSDSRTAKKNWWSIVKYSFKGPTISSFFQALFPVPAQSDAAQLRYMFDEKSLMWTGLCSDISQMVDPVVASFFF